MNLLQADLFEAGKSFLCPDIIRSVYSNQDDILRSIIKLHCPQGFECDLTYGNGSFWKNIARPRYCFDIEPMKEGVIQACSTRIPLDNESLSNCVFDPPFLTYIKGGRSYKNGKMAMAARYGGYYSYQDLESHYLKTIKEVNRVLKNNGVLVFKCQDIIHNHKLHCTHCRVIAIAEAEGFRLEDIFILTARSRPVVLGVRKQQHARIYHCFFLVFKKRKGKKDTFTSITQREIT